MRFIVDASTGPAVARRLSQLGHDVFSVHDDAPELPDRDILDLAVTQDRVVVTNDKDFGALVFQERRAHRGVILLRLDDERAETKMVVLNRVLRQRADEIAGNFVVASETTIRVRRG